MLKFLLETQYITSYGIRYFTGVKKQNHTIEKAAAESLKQTRDIKTKTHYSI